MAQDRKEDALSRVHMHASCTSLVGLSQVFAPLCLTPAHALFKLTLAAPLPRAIPHISWTRTAWPPKPYAESRHTPHAQPLTRTRTHTACRHYCACVSCRPTVSTCLCIPLYPSLSLLHTCTLIVTLQRIPSSRAILPLVSISPVFHITFLWLVCHTCTYTHTACGR